MIPASAADRLALRLAIFACYPRASICHSCRGRRRVQAASPNGNGKKKPPVIIDPRLTPVGRFCLPCWLKLECVECGLRAPLGVFGPRYEGLCECCLNKDETREQMLEDIVNRVTERGGSHDRYTFLGTGLVRGGRFAVR